MLKQYTKIIIFLLSVWGIPNQVNGEQGKPRPLIFGILPFMSPITMFNRFAPLRDYLSHQTHYLFLLETAPNFAEHLSRLSQRRYDLVLTAPHIIPLAIESKDYQVIAVSRDPIIACVIVTPESPIHTLLELAQKKVAIPPETSLITMIGRDMLMNVGLIAEKTPQYINFPSHNAAYQAVLGGQVDAAIVSINTLPSTTVAEKKFREISQHKIMNSIGFLVAKDLPIELQEQLKNIVLNMEKESQGIVTLTAIKYTGFQNSQNIDFDDMQHYAKRLKELELMPNPSP
ncbi:phosphate/phosphite/phosphonate ABC transporter substrate-binding protein [Beggiatoa leptomitoformis]|uniref:PhnD/SsuA/transferrin family substrate-binding protein n=1 Tax=Beggiatoa leptomitoformis TaxID=288004 RepID=A0A2N9YE68_9GAMM|nr:phosphate/phosphite/phosphonate ABC transporter substrate-binding protein [Beggiatoa leptomitoformis]ALG68844.1 PhnD/SsuA/transferrin family substrate-binding protein [Beggiatoa leptomitoformis]AUI68788.1 PhnD/SsuA/transferrin family substrate-binding protein [Beggiatoa leptomitoformis]